MKQTYKKETSAQTLKIYAKSLNKGDKGVERLKSSVMSLGSGIPCAHQLIFSGFFLFLCSQVWDLWTNFIPCSIKHQNKKKRSNNLKKNKYTYAMHVKSFPTLVAIYKTHKTTLSTWKMEWR